MAYSDGAQARKWLSVPVVFGAIGTASLVALGGRRGVSRADAGAT